MSKFFTYPSDASKSIKPCSFVKNQSLTLDELYEWLKKDGWCKETAYRGKFNPDNKCENQCNSTALLVQYLFSGDILKYKIKKNYAHFFNLIDGYVVDLTSKQFEPSLEESMYCCMSEKDDKAYVRYQELFNHLKDRFEKKFN